VNSLSLAKYIDDYVELIAFGTGVTTVESALILSLFHSED